MNDLNYFLGWYLGERTRMKRGLFNVVFFVATLAVLFFKMSDGLESMSKKATAYAPLMDVVENAMQDGADFDAYDVEGVMKKSQQTRDITRQLMRDFGFAGQKDVSHVEKGFDWGALLNLIVYIGLIPIVQMRLRDLGKWDTEMWVYTGFIYSGIAFDSMKELMGISLPVTVSAIGGVLSFILITWTCMAKSREVKRTSVEAANCMPGDNADDPY